MLVQGNPKEEKQIIEQLIEKNPQLQKEHELFMEEMRFKQELIDARRAREMTQKEVSELSGLSQQAVSRLEKLHGGTIDTVIKYLYAMGLKLTVQDV